MRLCSEKHRRRRVTQDVGYMSVFRETHRRRRVTQDVGYMSVFRETHRRRRVTQDVGYVSVFRETHRRRRVTQDLSYATVFRETHRRETSNTAPVMWVCIQRKAQKGDSVRHIYHHNEVSVCAICRPVHVTETLKHAGLSQRLLPPFHLKWYFPQKYLTVNTVNNWNKRHVNVECTVTEEIV
jgi:hypothetical protein